MDFENVRENTCREVEELCAVGQKWSFYVRVDFTFQMSSKGAKLAHDRLRLRLRQAGKGHSDQQKME